MDSHYEIDEYAQPPQDYDGVSIVRDGSQTIISKKGHRWTCRGSKGNRKAQAARYYKRNKSKRREYMKAYMANKRKK